MKSILLKIVLLLFLFTINSCKVNQTRDKVKIGRWVYSDTVNNVSYKTTGKYKNGIEKRRWLYYANNKIIKKENYKKDICNVINYHPNGKIASTGKTKLLIKDDLAHWFYFDEWLFYDEKGNYMETRTYNNGELMLNKSE